jgi:hypothetical protein
MDELTREEQIQQTMAALKDRHAKEMTGIQAKHAEEIRLWPELHQQHQEALASGNLVLSVSLQNKMYGV